MGDWTFADVYEAIAAAVPERAGQIQGDRVVTWASFDRRANAVAADVLQAGLGRQAKVAAYLANCPEYLETYLAAFKAGLVPVNVNYRYGPDELVYLLDNADAEAVVFHASFAEPLGAVRARLPRIRRWYAVDDGSGAVPDWAVAYEGVAGPGADRVVAPWGRSGDDLLLLYTGGTTGMPKGVMWRQDDLFTVLGAGGSPLAGVPARASIDEIRAGLGPQSPGIVSLPACPLMHGTGQFSALITMNLGGTIVTLASRRFDAGELWAEVERRRVNTIAIVGQAFAQPMLEYLDAHPGEHDLSSLSVISSSGVMWSQQNKDGLLRHLPNVILYDALGSSEAVGLGSSLSVKGAPEPTARFASGAECAVFSVNGERIEPGSGEPGLVAVGAAIPLGFYKDETKTASTFRTFEGRRWSVPGDWALVRADGTLQLLGRGSVCINTGGEKVFPEEVEEVLRTHPAVRDVVCVGVPDERFGEAVVAVVELAGAVDDAELTGHVRARLASFKTPRHIVVVDTIGRAANGKVDYRRMQQLAIERSVPA